MKTLALEVKLGERFTLGHHLHHQQLTCVNKSPYCFGTNGTSLRINIQHSWENLGEQKVFKSAIFKVFLKSKILATGATCRIYWVYYKPPVSELPWGWNIWSFFFIDLQADILQLHYRLTSLQIVFSDLR